MAVLERHIQTVRCGPAAYWEREKQFLAAEARVGGFPSKRYYNLLAGSDDSGTTVWEREWESFAVMEAAYNALFLEPGIQELGDGAPESGITERTEFYWVAEPQ
jgi:hypothetical protein